MVKIFIGNLPRLATREEIQELFEKYGKLTECDIIKNYGFVHMEDKSAADEAIKNLHHYTLHGVPINVESSKSKVKTSTKLHVGNIGSECTNQELRARFEEYGPVIECDIVKDFAFVHMEREEDAMEAIRGLDGSEFQGKRIHVQLSRSRLRTQPGMGEKNGCFRCGKEGHWSKECPKDRVAFETGYTYPPSYPVQSISGFGETPLYDERYGGVDYTERYRVPAYGAVGEPYYDQRSAQLASSMGTCGLDPYARHSLPPQPASNYYSRDRSPLRRAAAIAATASSGYGYSPSQAPAASMTPRSPYDVSPSAAGTSYLSRSQYSMY